MSTDPKLPHIAREALERKKADKEKGITGAELEKILNEIWNQLTIAATRGETSVPPFVFRRVELAEIVRQAVITWEGVKATRDECKLTVKWSVAKDDDEDEPETYPTVGYTNAKRKVQL